MQYRKDRYGNDISILGFGCMRLSRSGSGIDLDKAEREITAAMAHPEGMRTLPSFIMAIHSFRKK